jgi:hypothetical protein
MNEDYITRNASSFNPDGLQPPIVLADTLIAGYVGRHHDLRGVPAALVRTSGKRERKQGAKLSLHDVGLAIDYVVYTTSDVIDMNALAAEINDLLGPRYDVIYHDAGSGPHIHVEFDPKETE